MAQGRKVTWEVPPESRDRFLDIETLDPFLRNQVAVHLRDWLHNSGLNGQVDKTERIIESVRCTLLSALDSGKAKVFRGYDRVGQLADNPNPLLRYSERVVRRKLKPWPVDDARKDDTLNRESLSGLYETNLAKDLEFVACANLNCECSDEAGDIVVKLLLQIVGKFENGKLEHVLKGKQTVGQLAADPGDLIAYCKVAVRWQAWKRNKRRKSVHGDFATAQDHRTPPPEVVLERREMVDLFWFSVERLNGVQRDAIIARHIEGRSVREMADTAGKTEAAMKSILDRARKQLKLVLEHHGWTRD